jgi:Rieske 2Fe-2S family protein
MTADGGQQDFVGLKRLEPTLPSAYYYDPAQLDRELEQLWYRNWVYACRSDTLKEAGSYRTITIGRQTALLVRDEDGTLRAFHNTCRHRGSELCRESAGRLKSKLITCPYHAWGYDLKGNLRRVPSLSSPEGFDRKNFSLYPIALTEWRGLVFLCFDTANAPPFSQAFARGSDRLDNWPIEELVTGHIFTRKIACNWKIFWENFNECLHCPGVHPELCDMVPIYGRGIMSEREDPKWAEHANDDDPRVKGGLKRGNQSWTMDGKPVGETFAGLTEAERRLGYHYMTSLPSMFLVGHVDYMRITYLRPLGPEETELTAEWLFPAATLADPKADIAKAVDFAKIVLEQDADACELNQRGIRAIPHRCGVLMPEEMYLADFHQWVRNGLDRT